MKSTVIIKKKEMRNYYILLTFAAVILFSGCNSEDNLFEEMLPGYWSKEAIFVDGQPTELSDCEQSVRLLIERNGIYRLYSSCDDIIRAGTWLIGEDKILTLSMDRRRGNNYEPYPVKFSILELSDSNLEIRIRTFVGERKKTVMFTPIPPDDLTNLLPEEILEIELFNKQLKTYVYRFTKK